MESMTLSNKIRNCRAGAIYNPYQGSDKRVVFVCSMGLLRSPTAARMYANKYNTRCAGVWDDALIPLNTNLMFWGEELVFMHPKVYDDFVKKHGEDMVYQIERSGTKIKILDVSDIHEHMTSELQKIIQEQYGD
jgi:predicted protein tyrosine phosphatase